MMERKRGCPACGKSHTYDEPCDFRGHPRGRSAAPTPAPISAPVWGGHVYVQEQSGSVVGGENPAPMTGPEEST